MCLIPAEALGEVRVCVCVDDIGGIAQTSILLDSCLPPSDASHLRRRHRRPSKPSACLSPLIDLSLDWSVWECFGENMYFDRCSARECVLYTGKGKGRGLDKETLSGAWRWISRLCDALSCLKKAAGSLMARRLSNFTAAIWFVFLLLQSTLNSLSLSLSLSHTVLLSCPLVAP